MRVVAVVTLAAVLAASCTVAADGLPHGRVAPVPDRHGGSEPIKPKTPHAAVLKALQKGLASLKQLPGRGPHRDRSSSSRRHMASQQQQQQPAVCSSTAYNTAIQQIRVDCRSEEEAHVPFAERCSQRCVASIATNTAAFRECANDSGELGWYLQIAHACRTIPVCASAQHSADERAVAACVDQHNEYDEFRNTTAASIAEARSFCSSGCASRLAAYYRNWWQCFADYGSGDGPSMVAAGLRYLDAFCERPAGASDICGVEMKAFGRAQCGETPAMCSASLAEPGSWCQMQGQTCAVHYTQERLATLCGPCLQRMRFDERDEHGATVSIDELCMRTSTAPDAGYCLAALNTVLPAAPFATDIYQSMGTSELAVCRGVNASCVSKIYAARARAAMAEAKYVNVHYSSCGGPDGSCASLVAQRVAEARANTFAASGFCARNGGASSTHCLPMLYDFVRGTSAVCMGRCASSCPSTFNGLTSGVGCCGRHLGMFRYRAASDTSGLPATTIGGSQVLFDFQTETRRTVRWNTTVGTRSTGRDGTVANDIAACVGNTSAFWSVFETRCPTRLAAPPRGALAVSVPYARFAADAALKLRMEAALQIDTAAAMSVAAHRVNGSIVAAGAASQRQQASAQSSFVFTVDADSQAEADAAVAALNAQVAAGTLATPNVIEAATDCGEDCASSPVQGAASAPTPVPSIAPGLGSPAAAVGGFAGCVATAALVVTALL